MVFYFRTCIFLNEPKVIPRFQFVNKLFNLQIDDLFSILNCNLPAQKISTVRMQPFIVCDVYGSHAMATEETVLVLFYRCHIKMSKSTNHYRFQ